MSAEAVPVPPRERSAPDAAAVEGTAFSLFAGDALHAVYAELGMGTQARFRLAKRCVFVVLLTWVPVALLAWRQGLVGAVIAPTNFFADFAAYAQFLVALPLFVLGEAIIDASTRDAAQQFLDCGIVRSEDRARVAAIHAEIAGLGTLRRADVVCVAIAYALSLAILVPEFGANALPTWHVQGDVHSRALTAAGVWEFFVALPVLNYVWLRTAFVSPGARRFRDRGYPLPPRLRGLRAGSRLAAAVHVHQAALSQQAPGARRLPRARH